MLRAMEQEAEEFGKSADDKLKSFERVLDNNREVSIQEVITRMMGYGMCIASRITKFINTNKPEQRDGLLKGNLDELGEDENIFHFSIIDYYAARPADLESICLAEFASDYDIVSRGGKVVVKSEENDRLEEEEHQDDAPTSG